MRYLNHCCDPNLAMKFFWLGGCWHALLFALEDIGPGVELRFDYNLVTEDPEEPQLELACKCGVASCRGKLFAYREW